MPGLFEGVGEGGGAGDNVEVGVGDVGMERLHDNNKSTSKTRRSFLFMYVKRFYIGQSSCLFVEKYFPVSWRKLSLEEFLYGG